jgi:hypothetical protein
MFGRQPRQEDPDQGSISLITDLGFDDIYSTDVSGQPYDSFETTESTENPSIYVEEVPAHLRRPDGFNYLVTHPDGRKERVNAVRYREMLGVDNEDILANVGYEQPTEIGALKDILHTPASQMAETSAPGQGGEFVVKIAKLEGLEITGDAATLMGMQHMLQGRPTQEAIPALSTDEQLMMYIAAATTQRQVDQYVGWPTPTPYYPETNPTALPQYPYNSHNGFPDPLATDEDLIDYPVHDNGLEYEDIGLRDERLYKGSLASDQQYTPEKSPTTRRRSGRIRRLVGGAVLASVTAYGAHGGLSWFPFYGPEHQIQKSDFMKNEATFWGSITGK